jgi:phage protein D
MTKALSGRPDGASGLNVRALVEVGQTMPRPLPAEFEAKILRVVVDTHLFLPDMFEITFDDREGWLIDKAGLGIGQTVTVLDGKDRRKLIIGEITAIEARCAEMAMHTVVRGYEKAHRLQRAKRTRTFVGRTDSMIAARIAREAGLSIGTIETTRQVHAHVAQVVQTDWDFLQSRAREIGFETGMAEGKFYFRRASDRKKPVPADWVSSVPILEFKYNLRTFLPRLTAANLTPDVEVRVWDPWDAKVRVGRSDVSTGSALITNDSPKDLALLFAKSKLPHLGAARTAAGGRDEPSSTAYVVVDRPVGTGLSAKNMADVAAAGVAESLAGTYAEAEGYALGNPRVQAGNKIKVTGVPRQFEGYWVVTNAQHTFDDEDGGYYTRFIVSGRQDRTLTGLTSIGPAEVAEPPRINGAVCGVVTNVNDPERHNRVKVALPWLSPQYETDWARVVQFCAGRTSAAFFLPDVGDEVLLCFEFGDVRRPYVLGGLVNTHTSAHLGGPQVQVSGRAGSVVRRGIVTDDGNHLVFEDDQVKRVSKVALGTGSDDLALTIDKAAGSVTVAATPSTGPGSITIHCGDAGSVAIKAGPGGHVTVDGGANLDLKATAAVRIASDGVVEIKGTEIKLN